MPRPIFALAPMEEVTDVAFREMFARYSRNRNIGSRTEASTSPALPPSPRLRRARRASSPSLGEVNNVANASFVMYTEFVNVDGLTHPEGRKKLAIDLKFTQQQKPMVAQIWGTNPEKFYQSAQICAELGFDGIDINMGCPQDKEISIGACAALIREPKLAKEIIEAVKKGGGGLPVSVKTRIGYSKKEELEEWIKHLLSTEPAVIALHGRTKQEKSKVPANWEAIAQAVRIRDEMYPISPHPSPSPEPHPAFGHLPPEGEGKIELAMGRGKLVGLRPLIIGNGDIKSYQEGLDRVTQTKVDGVMVGRGAFGNPWFFRLGGEVNSPDFNQSYQPVLKERLAVMLEHAKLFTEWLPEKSFMIMRKHFKAYASGFPGSHELRAKLMEAKNLAETEKITKEFLQNQSYPHNHK